MRIVAFWDNHNRVAYRNQLALSKRLGDHCDLIVENPRGKHIDDIIKKYDPDCFYVHFSDRFNYPPTDFENIKIPKIMHDRNYFKLKSGWYDSFNFDLIIQCIPGLEYLSKKAPTIWMPLSANEVEFYNHKKERKRKVIFIGGRGGKWYRTRTKAIEILKSKNLLDDMGQNSVGKDYLDILNKYAVGLSDDNSVGAVPSKVYEMMACKTAVLMTDFLESEKIFGKGTCWFRYNENNIVDIAKIALFNDDLRDEITEKAYEVVHSKHMHKHRVAETYEVIETFVKKGKIINKWG